MNKKLKRSRVICLGIKTLRADAILSECIQNGREHIQKNKEDGDSIKENKVRNEGQDGTQNIT